MNLHGEQERPEDIDKTFKEIIEEHGFRLEEHTTQTEDGFILTVFRVTNSDGNVPKDAPVAFMQHGILDSGETWCMDAEKSPCFRLINAGYDVWMGNNRGTKHSRTNTHLTPESDAELYFDYTFYDLGKLDAPAQIDYVLEQTGKSSLSYIGHS